MPEHFKTLKLKISSEEKKARLEDYKWAMENNLYFGPPVDINVFLSRDIYDEYVLLKCLDCGFEEKTEFDIVEEMWDEYESDYPILHCPRCGKPKSVPIDIYHKQKLKVFK